MINSPSYKRPISCASEHYQGSSRDIEDTSVLGIAAVPVTKAHLTWNVLLLAFFSKGRTEIRSITLIRICMRPYHQSRLWKNGMLTHRVIYFSYISLIVPIPTHDTVVYSAPAENLIRCH